MWWSPIKVVYILNMNRALHLPVNEGSLKHICSSSKNEEQYKIKISSVTSPICLDVYIIYIRRKQVADISSDPISSEPSLCWLL